MRRFYEFDSPEALQEASVAILDDGRPRTYITKLGDQDYDIGVFADGKTISTSQEPSGHAVSLGRAHDMADALNGGTPETRGGAAVSLSKRQQLRESANESEVQYLESKKRETGDTAAVIYFIKRPHPTRLNGETITYYETGMLNGQNRIKLGVFSTKEEAREFAINFHGAMGPVQGGDAETSMLHRLTEIIDGFGSLSPSTEDIALAAKQLYYPKRKFSKVLASTRAKLYNCDRYFDAQGKGQWSLTDEGRRVARDCSISPQIDEWVGNALVQSEHASRGAAVQDMLFDDEQVEDPKSDWRETPSGRSRLRAGILIAMSERNLPPVLATMVFGQRMGDFLRGVTKSVPQEDVRWAGKMLRVSATDLECKGRASAELASTVKEAFEVIPTPRNLPTIRAIREKTGEYLSRDRRERDTARLNTWMVRAPHEKTALSQEVQDFLAGGKHPGAAVLARAIHEMRASPAFEQEPQPPKSSAEPPKQALLELALGDHPSTLVHEKYRTLDFSHSIYLHPTASGWGVGIVNDTAFGAIAKDLTKEEAHRRAQGMLANRQTVRGAIETLVGITTDPSSDLTRINFKDAGTQKTFNV